MSSKNKNDQYKRCTIVFNMKNQHHKELFLWCQEKSPNFSEFARTVLFMYREKDIRGVGSFDTSFPAMEQQPTPLISDASHMSTLL